MYHTFHILAKTMILQMKQSFARPMFRFCLLINPIMNTIFLYEMFKNQGDENFFSKVVLGAGLMGLWGCICFSSVGDINRERYSGTLPYLYVAPGGFGVVILGKVFGNTILSLVSFLLSYGVIFILKQGFLFINEPLYFFVALVVVIISFSIVSLSIAYIMMLSRKTELYMNLLEIPVIFLCGFTYPIEILPDWLQGISKMLPLTWAVRMFRMSAQVVDKEMFWKAGVILFGQLVVWILLTFLLYKTMDKQIRKKATLEVA